MDGSELPASIPNKSRVLRRRAIEEWTFEYTDDNKEKKYDKVTVDTMDTIDGRGKKLNTKITRKTFNTLSEAIADVESENDLVKKFVFVGNKYVFVLLPHTKFINFLVTDTDDIPVGMNNWQNRAPKREKEEKRNGLAQGKVGGKYDRSSVRSPLENRQVDLSESLNPEQKTIPPPQSFVEERGAIRQTLHGSDAEASLIPAHERRMLPATQTQLPDGSETELPDINPLILREKLRTPSETHGISLEEWRRNSSDLNQIVQGIQKGTPSLQEQTQEKSSEVLPGKRTTIADDHNEIFPQERRKSRSASRRLSEKERRSTLGSSRNLPEDLAPLESNRKQSEGRRSTTIPDHSLILDELRRLESNLSPNSSESENEPLGYRRRSQSRSKSLPYQGRRESRRSSAPARPSPDYEPTPLWENDSDAFRKNESEVEGSDYSEEESTTSEGDPHDSDVLESTPPLPSAFLKKLQERAQQGRGKDDVSSEDASEPKRRRSSAPKDDFSRDVLDSHNAYRENHGVKPLKYSSELSRFSQSWAESIAEKNELIHSTGSGYGENIYYKSVGKVFGNEPVDAWYDESILHTYGTNYFNPATGHFTQVIWKGSKVLGVGIATNSHGGSYVVVNYYPPGNIQTKFKSNVFPPIRDDYYT